MNFRGFATIATLCALSAWCYGQDKELKTSKEKVSYGFGLNVGRSMVRDGLKLEDLDFNLLVQGLKDSFGEQKIKLTEEEFRQAFQAAIAPKLEERAKAAAEKAKQEGEEYLAANKSKKGVKTTASGLQYRVLKQGTGRSPKAKDKVRTTYKGMFIDGTEFDASPQPIEFPVSGVIKGWTEALQLMKEGDRYELVIPADLAYGEAGSPQGGILPNSTLIFEVELIEVIPASAPTNAPKPSTKGDR